MRLPPLPVYYILIAGTWTADLLVSPLVQVYYLRNGNLSMWQLALVGAILAVTQFIFEIPTGLVADGYSRRLSIIIGVFLAGVSYVIEGSIPRFEVFVITAIILGVGNTFISGAATAWLTDELGEDDVSPVLLRAMRIGQICGLAAIVLSGLLGNLNLGLPIVAGGIVMLGLSVVLLIFMPERKFKPALRESRSTIHNLLQTARDGFAHLRVMPALWLLLGASAIYGLHGEGVGRFWEAHVLIDLGLPSFFSLNDVTWFSVINIAAMLISIAGIALTERLLPRMHPSQLLPWLYGLLAVALLAFALAPAFGAGMAAFLAMILVSSPIMPMFEAYFNQHLQSDTRATMLSLNSQVSAVGRIAGGLMLGVIASVSISAALVVSALILVVAILLVRRFEVAKLTQSSQTQLL